MRKRFNHNIAIIGNGNVAWHLAYAFKNAGIKISAIIGRSEKCANELADSIGTCYNTDFSSVPPGTTLVLICISDSAIEAIAGKVKDITIPVAHTAGSVPLSVFNSVCVNAGVFYPFQTFTKDVRLGEVEFPVCIEANNSKTLEMLSDLGNCISKKVIHIDSESRRKLHLSGVIANNFPNFFFTRAFDYLEENNIDTSLLIPLIQETSNKIRVKHPADLQTGPARRGDKKIIDEHLNLLAGDQNLSELYGIISENITAYFNRRKWQTIKKN
jgi:predicted short-subunit dehydrogenase-like oxidoreductase (DUF2520 family)